VTALQQLQINRMRQSREAGLTAEEGRGLPAGEVRAKAWQRVWAGLLALFAGPSGRAPAHPARVLVHVYVCEVVNLHVPAYCMH
jgi:hypothetical protein